MGFDESLFLPSGDAELKLHVRNAARPRAVLQVNHGLAEHSARYARLAGVLAESGVSTFAHDHRGHGGTIAPDAPLGSFGPPPAADRVLADVASVHDFIRRRHPGLPVFVLGHSMGGLIALNFAMAHSHRIAGAAIWNAPRSAGAAAILAGALLRWERMRLGSDAPSRFLPRMTFRQWGKCFTGTDTGFDWLSRDADEVRLYANDPLCGWDASVGVFLTIFELGRRAEAKGFLDAARRDLPLYLVGGSDDPVTEGGKDVSRLAGRLAAAGFSNLETTIYDENRHESLNELNRDLITARLGEWIDANMPSGR